MDFKSAQFILEKSNSDYFYDIFIPSLNKKLQFKSMTTGQRKSISKLSINSSEEYDIKYEFHKLNLFDTLLINKNEADSNSLREIDLISFLAGLRLNNVVDKLELSITCSKCKHSFSYIIDLEKIIEKCKNYKVKELLHTIKDNNRKIEYEFLLSDPFYQNIIQYNAYVQATIKDLNYRKQEVLLDELYLKPLLFINGLKINNEAIQDWNDLSFVNKIEFLNTLSPDITDNLTDKIQEEFKSSLNELIFDTITCNLCQDNKEGVITSDIFFVI